ncbi:MAG: CARDB domain-containing protein [Nostoc sp.]|uniref:CARDB domain-containing protein n=1 Tax=Nostoc sp. TaxID=1180 RepID=UPI002FFA5C70
MNNIDLIVSSVTAPLYVTLGETIPMSWTVKNQSTDYVLANYWNDYIYISNDQILDQSDTFLFSKYGGQNTPLAATGSYTATENISIPNSVARGNISRYLLFVTDGGNNQGETNETNNVFAQPITINAPDLVVTAANVPIMAELGETISVSWTVKNQGTVSASSYWYDFIYISNDQFLDDSDSFVLYTNSGRPLASGSSYTDTSDIFIPDDVGSGVHYLLFVADGGEYYNNQLETNDDNNVFAQAITINDPPDVDLVITAANAPTIAGLGETISVSWTVKNQGTASTSSDWYDYIYISDDQFFDESDFRLTDGYIRENKLLASGSSYTITEDISIDNFVALGDRYLLFVADHDHSQGETNETNNVFAQAIAINNAPDLVVTAANAPASVALNERISVSWTVKNQSTISAKAYNWYDAVYISDDQFFDNSDTQLAFHERRENTPLASDSSYTVTQDIYISNFVGNRYLLFVADKDHYQGETNETNNVFAQAITIAAPDFVVTAASAPTTAALGETISVSWTVKNQGTTSGFFTTDYIYISNDQFFDSSDTLVGEYSGWPLGSASNNTATQNISIPNTVAPGDRYLLFVADGRNNQVETNEDNNVFAQAITINDAPDLVITAANAPTTAALGETISVSWTVKNQGLVSASSNWYDYIYISDDQFFDYSDTYLSRRDAAENTPLASGGSYTATQDISIFNFLQKIATGDRYLLFVADGGGYLDENQIETNETNNVFAQAITIAAPDLVITTANAPTTAVLGETISVSWTVKNQGTVSALADWYDTVYISDDQFLDNSDRQLASRYAAEDTPLASGGSYTATQDIYLDSYVGTGRYLLFVTDGYNYQVETNETNNVFAQAITINAPDLVVTAASAPTTAALGETISVSWTVKNQGLVSAFTDWYDGVYISDDQFLDNSDTALTERYAGEDTPLASEGSYTATKDIFIPNSVGTGDVYDGLRQRYLLFVADTEYFGNNQGETNETNNVFAQAITIGTPDLVITAANAPTTAALNETISVSWTVKNQGLVSAFANWYDYVYISDDQFFDESDTYLTGYDTRENTPLASGGSYTATLDISIGGYGYVATGDRYLLFVTDAERGWSGDGDNQGETNEDNNVFAQAITIAAPDLVITAANAPTTAALNETISVSWTVKNQGIVSAFADWYDYIYISDDQFFDDSDTQLTNRYAGEDTPLISGGSYTATHDISIFNSVATGDRYLLFVADRGYNNQAETNEDNNVFAQAITINAPDLIVTAANAPTTAALNETISVSWTVKNQGLVSAFADWYDKVYISDDQFFDESDTQLTYRDTGENTPLASGGSYTVTQDIYIDNSVATGDRYLLFVADAGGGWSGDNQGETNEDNNVFAQAITIAAPDLIVTAANAPTTAGLNETISVSWTVKNQGLVSAFADWSDTVYISDDQFLDYFDTYLSRRDAGENTPLAAADSYTATQDISIPDYVGTGDVYDGLRQRYLLFVADRGYNNQAETNEDNNVFAQAITINAPDLIVTAANAPTTAALNETISVSWTVKNQGLVSAFADWYDKVYISDDQFFDESDTQLTYRDTGENTPLASGGSYTVTQDIYIDNSVATGDRYLLFVTDAGGGWSGDNQGETNKDNNVFAQAITIAAPDLVVTAANAPTTAALNETISVSWTVKNQGTVSAFANWYDYVYISDDQFFDYSDTYLTSRYAAEETPLAAADSYTATQDISIPNYIATGDHYLLFVADRGYYGGNYQGETNKDNNVFAQAITIAAPDLVITAANAPTTAALNETISVSWTVKNQGTVSAFGNWYDSIYISDDQFFDYSDTYLTSRYAAEETPLAAAGSYTVTQDIYIPNYLATGDRYLLFVADVGGGLFGDNQGETNETNNVFAQAITINTPDVDLVITAANAPTTAVSNETISVSWTVKNQGTVPALADWYDAVYISDDQFFDYSDTYLTDHYTGENTPLAAAGSYTATQDISIPNYLATGDRYLLFVADRYYYGDNYQGETNENNNIQAVAISLYAQDQIFNGTSSRDTLTGNDSNNLITGLQGADTLTGGAGSDRFVYTSSRDAGDTITDFVAATDKIDLTKLLQSFSLDSLNYETATTQGYLSFGTLLSNTTVLIDIDGTAGRARPTQLLTVQGLSQSTLAQSDNFLL